MEQTELPTSSARKGGATSSIPLLSMEPEQRTSPDGSPSSQSRNQSPPTNRWQRFQDKCNDLWVWEISACILSIFCMSAVAGILFRIQGKALSSWTFSIAPNSLMSVFVTMAKSSMLLVVAQCVSHMRWVHYQTGAYPLVELETFDAASRGPLGSLLFVLKMRGRSWLTSVGCVLIILALAIDPFTQQICGFPTRSVEIEDTNGTLAWLPSTYEIGVSNSEISQDIYRASLAGFHDLGSQLIYGCASGNCTWPTFATFGYCSTCVDVTDTVKSDCLQFYNNSQNCRTINVIVSDGNHIVIHNGTSSNHGIGYDFTIAKSKVNYGSWESREPMLLNIGVVRLRGHGRAVNVSDGMPYPDTYRSGWEITDCTVTYCAKVYEGVESTNGTISRNTIRDVTLVPSNTRQCLHYRSDGSYKTILCKSFKPADPSELPTRSETTYYAAIIHETLVFSFMNCEWISSQEYKSRWSGEESTSLIVAKAFMIDEDLPGTFDRITNSMTDSVRVASAYSKHVGGMMYVQETYVEVKWRWFALPVALVLLAMVFLVASIWMSKRRKLGCLATWKSSSMPLLVYGMDGGWTAEEQTKWASQKGRRSAVQATLTGVEAQLRVDEDENPRFVRE